LNQENQSINNVFLNRSVDITADTLIVIQSTTKQSNTRSDLILLSPNDYQNLNSLLLAGLLHFNQTLLILMNQRANIRQHLISSLKIPILRTLSLSHKKLSGKSLQAESGVDSAGKFNNRFQRSPSKDLHRSIQ
jgi:hypothetical protein